MNIMKPEDMKASQRCILRKELGYLPDKVITKPGQSNSYAIKGQESVEIAHISKLFGIEIEFQGDGQFDGDKADGNSLQLGLGREV